MITKFFFIIALGLSSLLGMDSKKEWEMDSVKSRGPSFKACSKPENVTSPIDDQAQSLRNQMKAKIERLPEPLRIFGAHFLMAYASALITCPLGRALQGMQSLNISPLKDTWGTCESESRKFLFSLEIGGLNTLSIYLFTLGGEKILKILTDRQYICKIESSESTMLLGSFGFIFSMSLLGLFTYLAQV